MQHLLNYLEQLNISGCGAPLSLQEALKTFRELSFPLPEQYMRFLGLYNGISGNGFALLALGADPDIRTFNQKHNKSAHQLILGYDEFSFLVYDSEQKLYLLVDRSSSEVIEEFLEDEFEFALNSILHFEND